MAAVVDEVANSGFYAEERRDIHYIKKYSRYEYFNTYIARHHIIVVSQ